MYLLLAMFLYVLWISFKCCGGLCSLCSLCCCVKHKLRNWLPGWGKCLAAVPLQEAARVTQVRDVKMLRSSGSDAFASPVLLSFWLYCTWDKIYQDSLLSIKMCRYVICDEMICNICIFWIKLYIFRKQKRRFLLPLLTLFHSSVPWPLLPVIFTCSWKWVIPWKWITKIFNLSILQYRDNIQLRTIKSM